MTSPIQQIQEDIAARLQSYPDFAHVPVLIANDRNEAERVLLITKLNEALAGKVGQAGKAGLTVIILVPEIGAVEGDAPGPLMRADCTISVIENPLINRGANGTGILPELLALTVLRLLHQWSPGTGGCFVAPDTRAMVKGNFQDKIAWEVTLSLPLLQSPIPTSPMPRIAVADGEVSLTAAGADEIWYSLDGSMPRADAAGSVQYSAPFTITDPGSYTLRAISRTGAMADSGVRQVLLTVSA